MPDVAWTLSHDDLGRGLSFPIGAWLVLFIENSSDSRCAQVKSRPAKGVSDPHLPHGGTKSFESPDQVADKVRESVDRLRKLQEGIWSFFADSPHL
jgi:hypothetical protein